MSYAGPSGQKNSARPPLQRPAAPRRSSSSDRNVAFLAGVIVGATVGAGVALLLAPQSGQSTRRRLVQQGRRVTRRGRNAWEDLADELRNAWHRRREARDERDERDVHVDASVDASTDDPQRKSFSLRAASSL